MHNKLHIYGHSLSPSPTILFLSPVSFPYHQLISLACLPTTFTSLYTTFYALNETLKEGNNGVFLFFFGAVLLVVVHYHSPSQHHSASVSPMLCIHETTLSTWSNDLLVLHHS